MARENITLYVKLRKIQGFDPTKRPPTSLSFTGTGGISGLALMSKPLEFHMRHTDPGGNGAGWLRACIIALRLMQANDIGTDGNTNGATGCAMPTVN